MSLNWGWPKLPMAFLARPKAKNDIFKNSFKGFKKKKKKNMP